MDLLRLRPDIIYVSQEAQNDLLTRRVCSRLPEVPVTILAQTGDPMSELGYDSNTDESQRFTAGKKQLLLTRHHGSWMRACPGTSHHVCCNLWTVDPGEGCPMDCTYCYLQSYLRRNPTLKIFTNIDAMLGEIEQRTHAQPERLFRIGTGEVVDSLVWDPLTDFTQEVVPRFAALPNAVLELKTKTNCVDNLLTLKNEHQGKTVVSWSVNAKTITENDEAFTASLSERIEAAARVADAGYRVGFHFDPLIYFEGWQDEYRDTIQSIFTSLQPEQIAWVSISSLRYRPDMQRIMLDRFPQSSLPFGEQFLAKDGKLRYIQPLRLQMLHFVWNELKSYGASLPVYMCMESSVAWHHVAGGPPVAGQELVEVFSRRGKLPILPANDKETNAKDQCFPG